MRKKKRIMAVLMSVLMLVGVTPTDWAVQTVKAATQTYSFEAASSGIENLAKKAAIAAGTTYADGYIKVVGEGAVRSNSSTPSIEVGKNQETGLEFTVTGTADVKFTATSTGSSNTSVAGLVDEHGNVVVEKSGKTTVLGSGAADAVTFEYTGLAAGTYTITAPKGVATEPADSTKDLSSSRGVRILTARVDETVAVVTDHDFDAATSGIENLAKKAAIAAGTTYADGYLKVVGDGAVRSNSSTPSIEVGKNQATGLEFTVTGTADVKFTATSTGSSNTSVAGLVDGNGNVVAEKSGKTTVLGSGAADAVTFEYTGLAAGTYTITAPKGVATEPADSTKDLSSSRGVRILTAKITETTGGSRPARADWSSVAAPVLGDVTLKEDKLELPVSMNIGYDGADSVAIEVKNSAGQVVDTLSYAKEGSTGTVTYAPAASGDYTFTIKAVRSGEADKAGNVKSYAKYWLPLGTPSFKSATSAGNGKMDVEWNELKEADSYDVSFSSDGGTTYSAPKNITGTSYSFTGMTIDQEYTFKLVGKRNADAAVSEAATIKGKATKAAQMKWVFSAFGQGINTKNTSCDVTGDIGALDKNATVTMISGSKKNGGKDFDSNCGKLVPANTDGLSFYYTAIPSDKNFTLTATAKVNMWHLSNGQEGFGLMAADAVGTNGDVTPFWNNSYMALASKVEYFYNTETDQVSDAGDKISMKLGVGSQEKLGVTKDNLSEFNADSTSALAKYFKTSIRTLETSCAKKGAGTYNLLANYDKSNADSSAFTNTNVDDLMTEIKLTIQKNNTGYFVTYTDTKTGESTTNKYYDTDALNKIDTDNVYAGLFTSRYADVTFSDISLTTIDASADAPKEERPIELVTPKYAPVSASTSNTNQYKFAYIANADGVLNVKDADGNVVIDQQAITANAKFTQDLTLKYGKNNYSISFAPNADYKPDGEFSAMSSYDAQDSTFTVEYRTYGQADQSLWVSADGDAKAAGSDADPVDIYTAVKFVQPGQTIVLKGGTYNLESTVVIPRGADGTDRANIRMIADPDATSRPVFDFGKKCAGMIFAGNYWYVQGFDVTNSQNAQKGIQVSGSNNTFDQVNTYYNGNTGLQISRYLVSDLWEDWPANNYILNCSSYCNADAGYEDADGFAAKLTIGDGNVFDGCISHHNADDGWDLFAKPESGAIGAVTIQNCVAYSNGFWINEDGQKVEAGNGNGFKMGGSSIAGGHKLINSVSYDNKAKGIDSNSCPDIKVENCTSYNNGSYNVALYTGAKSTDYAASGIASYRKGTDVEEQIKPLAPQTASDLYTESNYFWDTASKTSKNSVNDVITDDWFVSTDTTIVPTRFTDGTINMNGLLVLTDKAKAGAVVKGAASAKFSVPTSVPNVRPDLGTADQANDKTNTSDTANFILLMALCLISGSVYAGFYFFDKKRRIAK